MYITPQELKSQVRDLRAELLAIAKDLGGEIQFLYIDNNNKKEIVSRCGIKGSGDLQKYPTLKSNERGYEFMPKLSKQVGYSQLIIPFVYSNNLGFAKIDFSL